MERNIRLDIAYDGTEYEGWQVQTKGGRTIQGEIEKALGEMHRKPVRLTGSGRTDSGVHAAGQVANFKSSIESIKAENFTLALNSLLPRDIRILSSRQVTDSFHSRFDAVKRVYYYYLKSSTVVSPFDDRYCYTLRDSLDLKTLNTMVRSLVGTHDFTTFTVPRDQSKTRIRSIYSAACFHQGPYVIFKISGNAFLWRMVRSIVGTLMECYTKGRYHDFRKKLEAADRNAAGPTAPSRGLFLQKVFYKEDDYFPI